MPRGTNTDQNQLPKRFQNFHNQAPSNPRPTAVRHQQSRRIGAGFAFLGKNNHRALKIAEEILTTDSSLNPRDYQDANQLKARALLKLGRVDDCLQTIEQVDPPLDKGFLMTKGRALQAKKSFREALSVFQELYHNHSKKENDKKVHGLALGRQYQDMGQHQAALTIFKQLRTCRSGHEGAPCHDKDIELTLGRQYQCMGQLQAALGIFKNLRVACSRDEGTPCNDKEIELALGRQYHYMGQPQAALGIFKNLHAAHSGDEGTLCHDKDIELTLGRQYQYMGQPQTALTIFKQLRAAHSGHEGTPCNDKDIELTLGRQYQNLGQDQAALTIFKQLRTDRSGHESVPCNDKDVELALGRQHQYMRQHQAALTIFKQLRAARSGHESVPCNDKDVELALGRQYQYMGQHQDALTIFKRLHVTTHFLLANLHFQPFLQHNCRGAEDVSLNLPELFEQLQLRTDRSGHETTPGQDKDIELTLGPQYRDMAQHQEALTIFKQLRTDRSSHEAAHCHDKDIELALGRQYQCMGQHQEGLTIFKQLRTARSGYESVPCNDKDVELALGRQYQYMGQYQAALTIFKKLRTDRSGHESVPCKDKDVELALGDIHVELMNWDQFDQIQFDEMGFAGPELDLCTSIRYFKECIRSCNDNEVSRLLAKAINYACDAIEKSRYLNAASFSQLAHCIRIAALLPCGKTPDTFAKNELKNLVSIFFAEANKLAPGRQDQLKNEVWRRTEREFLARLSSGH